MKNIISKIIFMLFCLIPSLGIAMDSIFEMQEGLKLNNGSAHHIIIPPIETIERFEPVGENAKKCLKQMIALSSDEVDFIGIALPTDIWEQIWKKLSDKTKTRLSKLSREFNRTFYQSMLTLL